MDPRVTVETDGIRYPLAPAYPGGVFVSGNRPADPCTEAW